MTQEIIKKQPYGFLKFKTALLLIALLGLNSHSIYAQQEAQYSQYMFNLLNINPAYAGNREVHNITILYRNQWAGIDGAPRTGTLSWDHRNADSNVGYGVQIGSDRLGIEATTFVKGFYSYRIPFKNSALSLGVDVGVLNYRADYTKLSTTTSSDPLLTDNINRTMPRFGVGALYESEKFYVGFSIPDLLNTKTEYNDNLVNFIPKPHFYLNGGMLFNIDESIKLKPSMLIKTVSGAPVQVDFNVNGWYNNTFGLGLSYRTKDAIVSSFELQITPSIRLGYAYDFAVNNLKSYNSKGTHEIMLRFEINGNKNDDNSLSPRYY